MIVYTGRRINLALFQDFITHNSIFRDEFSKNNSNLIETIKPLLRSLTAVVGYFIEVRGDEVKDSYYISGRETERLTPEYYIEKKKSFFSIIDIDTFSEEVLDRTSQKVSNAIYSYYSNKNQVFDIISFSPSLDASDRIYSFNLPIKKRKIEEEREQIFEMISEKVDYLYSDEDGKTILSFRLLNKEKVVKIESYDELYNYFQNILYSLILRNTRYIVITNIFQNRVYSEEISELIVAKYYKDTANMVRERIEEYKDASDIDAVRLFMLVKKFLPKEFITIFNSIEGISNVNEEIFDDGISVIKEEKSNVFIFPESDDERKEAIDNIRSKKYDKNKNFFTNDDEVLEELFKESNKFVFLNLFDLQKEGGEKT
ncbi:MAG: hypothetical protein RMJ67_01115 [Elusimicrobiota bacterium]|nr:hypothetical protein [Endomicrobiia bacterium]MDW8165103.1 hypothetical protein [Elusimicrobiota bacterium]